MLILFCMMCVCAYAGLKAAVWTDAFQMMVMGFLSVQPAGCVGGCSDRRLIHSLTVNLNDLMLITASKTNDLDLSFEFSVTHQQRETVHLFNSSLGPR